MFAWDLARFGEWADKAFTKARVQDQYANRFKIHFPYEERDAGRPARRRPAYAMQKEIGAVFGLNFGWEHPLWFAPKGVTPTETYGFTRQPWFDHVGTEAKAVRENVGIIDISNFAKYEVKGKGANDWLDRLIANRVPSEVGRSCLTPLIGKRGGISGDFTVTKLGEEHFFMVGSGMAERYHQRFFNEVPRPETVSFKSLTVALCGVNVAGPKARTLLSRLTQEDLSNEAFPFMRSRRMTIAGVEAIVIRVSFTGDLGWELYVEEADQVKLYSALMDNGKDLGIHPVGSRALLSLRIEKGYGSWGREYSPEYWPQEVSLDRLIKMEKPDFLGKAAYAAIAGKAPREKLVLFDVDADHADATGGEPIFLMDGTPVGRVSSGAYGYSVGKSLALGFVKTEYAAPGTNFYIAILGMDHRATLLSEPPFDPKGAKLRS